MDKETLALLISALTEIEIIELYKIKKVNNFGFRANTIDDVCKNRHILENNLLKPINMKHVQGYFVLKATNSEIKTEGLEWNELKELCESEGYSKVLIALYVNGKKEVFEKIVIEYSKKTGETQLQSPREIEVVDNVAETRSNKTIKKLEMKLNNITEEFQKKEYDYKLELQSVKKLIVDLRKENMLLKQDLNIISKENNQYKQEINFFENENVNLNGKLLQQNETYSNEIQILIKEISVLKVKIKQLENNKTQIATNNQAVDMKVEETTPTYEIAVLGESNEITISEKRGIHFEFIEGEAIKEFTIDNNTKYDEIWIIHYDLTQKQKRLVQMKDLKSNINIKIEDIHSLKELNQAMINIKKTVG
ncbi:MULTISPECIES: hypothetical protein [Lysinibacillus]|uniref:hypothetical protein n=1 Tax=Lysinibacillus TaxID=400634 RepID=UPI0021A58397|nr:hypothetical protein [Lysinibacillus capsici]MCT1540258.1 hypothetical protein [Lysinibacillus capsici]MCT1571327.1 hypothetical protein [Lysinibacillus capsici]MCT1647883.1 hypothetical protein [Lysinibacillus capsici]MCT1726425.1 hypothetical protein [Lysinibacillus capsici]MCT1783529.1 hypothetical protein [Lysinibacillus capsici]